MPLADAIDPPVGCRVSPAAPWDFAREAVAAVGGSYDLSKVRRVHVGSDGEGWCKAMGAFMPGAEAVGHPDPFHVYGVRMDSFPCAWSVRGASDMARLRCRSLSGREIPRMARERSMSAKRLSARRRRELSPYEGAAGRIPSSVGRSYEPPHRASVVGMAAEVCYAADVDGGMVAIKGWEFSPTTSRRLCGF